VAPGLLGVLGVLGVAWLAAPYTVDDAFIVVRYVQNLAMGRGYAFNPDVPSDGITGPAWIIPLYVAARVHDTVDPLTVLKVTGAVCAALAAWQVVARARARALGVRGAWASALVLACLPDIGTWAVAGLETGAALLALTVLAFALLDRPHPRFARAVIATTALAWLRPDVAPCVLVLWLAPITRAPRGALPWAAAALLGGLSVVAWRLWLFGHALPLSASAKPAVLDQGAQYVVTGTILMTSGLGVALAVHGARAAQRRDRFMLGAIAVHLGAVALAGGDWMPGARLLVPVAGLYALLVGRGVARLSLKRPIVAIACVLVTVSVPALDMVVRVPELRATAHERSKAIDLWHVTQGLNGAGPVAVLDVGFIGYHSRAEIIDLGGLTDEHIARLPGGHIDKRIDEAYLKARNPKRILLHSTSEPEVDDQKRLMAFSGYPVEHRIATMPWVQEHFRVALYVELNPSYGYVVLEPAPSLAR
jgi:hypothetical protein